MSRLLCMTLDGHDVAVQPASSSRAWMDATSLRYAYRCLPLTIANGHGWDIVNPRGFEAVWDGGTHDNAITIAPDLDAGSAVASCIALSHFGLGVLTLEVRMLFRTDPGWALWVGGPANSFKDAIQPLTAVVETDWAPYTFTMNWKFTRSHSKIRFEQGEPFCTIFPVQLAAIEAVRPLLAPLSSFPEERNAYDSWTMSRRNFLSELKSEENSSPSGGWQKDYFQGKCPMGSRTEIEHRTKLKLEYVRNN